MKKVLLPAILCCLHFHAHTQTFQWAKSTGGAGKDEGISLAVDAAGNSYSTGSFRGTIDFDPGPGTVNLTAVADNDIFVSKMDAQGNLVWAKSFGSANYEVGIDIAVDASGSVYVTGNYSGTIDFDPGPAVTTLTAAGNPDIFVLKLDAAGNFVFARSMGGTGVDVGYSIAVDASSNIYTTGSYSGTADFDPGAGVYNFSSLKNGDDIFVCKLNSSGTFVWARTAGGGNADQGTAIAVDAAGNVFVTGFNNVDANFNPAGNGAGGFVTYVGGTDIFLMKFDTGGAFQWVKGIGSTGNDVGYGITVDPSGNIYATGYFFGTADFDPGAGTFNLTSAGTNVDIFVVKLDASGNFVWAKGMGGTNGDVGYSIVLDGAGNIYTYGAFAGTADFDPGAGTVNVTSAGLADVFISKLNSSGNFISIKTFGGLSDDIGYAMGLDAAGNIYTTGIYNGTADFDPDAPVFNLTSNGGQDIFNSRVGSFSLPVTLLGFDAAKNENDTYLSWKTATEVNTDKFEIERSDDGILFNKVGEVKAIGNSSITNAYRYADKNAGTNYPNKNLYYRLKQLDRDGQFTYSVIRSIKFDKSEFSMRVYPNPSYNTFRIEASPALIGLSFRITDGLGKQVRNGTINNTVTLVDIRNIATGVYFYKSVH